MRIPVLSALVTYQSDDGSWRQVVDEPTSYHELTVTAMTVAAMARGMRLGVLDRSAYQGAVDRGWKAVVARVNEDGTVRDVCSSTGAGPSKEYYTNRPAVNGADDRGAAMALLAATRGGNAPPWQAIDVALPEIWSSAPSWKQPPIAC